jgi:V/A-type H+-transporting ATPase subunit I
MIVYLHKYLFYGPSDLAPLFFSLAQEAGFIEFIGAAKKGAEIPPDIKLLLSAIKIGKKHEVHPLEGPRGEIDPLKIAETIIRLDAEIHSLEEEERKLHLEISRIAVYGEFSMQEIRQIEELGKRHIQFFCRKSSLSEGEEPIPDELIYVGTDFDLDYFLSIAKEKRHYPKMVELHIDQPVQELKERLLIVQEKRGKGEADLRHYCNALPKLEELLLEAMNGHALQQARSSVSQPLGEALFAIEGWVPRTQLAPLAQLLSRLDVAAEEIAVEEADKVPTCLENRGAAKIGEDLVQIYDTPAPTDRDPSGWVLVFFSLFFAMIVADAGYGLIYLLIACLLKWKFPHLKGVVKRLLNLLFILSFSIIGWGVATASYFGIDIDPDNPLRKTSLLHTLAIQKAEYIVEQKGEEYREIIAQYPQAAGAQDGHAFLMAASKIGTHGRPEYPLLADLCRGILMEFSLLAGMIHIAFSLCRYLARSWSNGGWLLFLAGGYLYFPSIVGASTILNFTGLISEPAAHSVGLQLIYLSLAVALVAGFLQKRWGALLDMMNAIQVFADVLSYLRLFALALAGMIMADTFNNTLGIEMGFVASALLIFIGHFMNLGLALMGGTIHGLRLNFLEWYHYCFEGGGRLFNPLRIKRKE